MPGDSVKAEAGAMVTMSNNVDLEARIEGGAGDACLRCCCAGESLFMSHFTLKAGMVRACGCMHLHTLEHICDLPEASQHATDALQPFQRVNNRASEHTSEIL